MKAVEARSPLQVRIGVATGPVVVGETGSGDASVPKLAVGETPNLAARLQGLAQADDIVIAAATRRLVGGAFDLEDLGAHALKGIVEAVRGWRVVGVAATAGRFEAAHGAHLTPLFGRDEETALLLRRWRQAADGGRPSGDAERRARHRQIAPHRSGDRGVARPRLYIAAPIKALPIMSTPPTTR